MKEITLEEKRNRIDKELEKIRSAVIKIQDYTEQDIWFPMWQKGIEAVDTGKKLLNAGMVR